jgi:hypothetical protein
MITTLLAAMLVAVDQPETIKVPAASLSRLEMASKDYLLAKKDQEILKLQFEKATRAEADASIASKAAVDAIFAEAKVSRADYELKTQTGELVRKPVAKK